MQEQYWEEHRLRVSGAQSNAVQRAQELEASDAQKSAALIEKDKIIKKKDALIKKLKEERDAAKHEAEQQETSRVAAVRELKLRKEEFKKTAKEMKASSAKAEKEYGATHRALVATRQELQQVRAELRIMMKHRENANSEIARLSAHIPRPPSGQLPEDEQRDEEGEGTDVRAGSMEEDRSRATGNDDPAIVGAANIVAVANVEAVNSMSVNSVADKVVVAGQVVAGHVVAGQVVAPGPSSWTDQTDIGAQQEVSGEDTGLPDLGKDLALSSASDDDDDEVAAAISNTGAQLQ